MGSTVNVNSTLRGPKQKGKKSTQVNNYLLQNHKAAFGPFEKNLKLNRTPTRKAS